MNIQDAISHTSDGENLNQEQMTAVMRQIMQGQATDIQIASLLTALKLKGETVDEITAAAKVMREMSSAVKTNKELLLDTCGTGGDGCQTFNISTTSAFVIAAAGIAVAKHGNRSVSSSSGSADLLERAGININLNPAQVTQCIDTTEIGFMFAPQHHKAMKHAANARKQLGTRTIFNLLGPLTNPAGAKYQLLGVYDDKWVEPIAAVLKQLGSERAMVVHSKDGLDEISLSADTYVAELNNGKITTYTVSPKKFGLNLCKLSDLKVENVDQSFTVFLSVLKGEDGPAKDIVALNAGAALYIGNIAESLAEGIKLANKIITDKAAFEKYELLKSTSQKLSTPPPTEKKPEILAKIINHKKNEIQEKMGKISLAEFKSWAVDDPPVIRDFKSMLEHKIKQNTPGVIAEIKKASPSKGILRENFDPRELASEYQDAGAACLSVLTDKKFFMGSGAILDLARSACGLPVLRKDFIISPYQVYETRAMGADCFLLIVAALNDDELRSLHQLGKELDLDVLVEVHNQNEMERALEINADIIGINNRNLSSFEVSLDTTLNLIPMVPTETLLITESGIHTAKDVKKIQSAGVNTFLVGESLMTAKSPGKKLKEIFFSE
jgi:anthranilate phosphoribosyltransferase